MKNPFKNAIKKIQTGDYDIQVEGGSEIINMTNLPSTTEALDWLIEGSWDGSETAESVKAEWDSYAE